VALKTTPNLELLVYNLLEYSAHKMKQKSINLCTGSGGIGDNNFC